MIVSICCESPEKVVKALSPEIANSFRTDSTRFDSLMENARKTLDVTAFNKAYVEIDPDEQKRLLDKLRLSLNR